MSDTKVARLPQQQTLPATTTEIDFPTMLMLCIEKGIDPQVIVQMHNEQQDRRQRAALNLAMAEAYGDVLPVLKDAQNKHLGNRYTTVPAIMAMLQPILRKYDIFVGFDAGMLPGEPAVADGCIRVRIVVSHGGYSDRASYLDEPISRGGVRGGVTQMTEQQAITSATTYAQRTLLKLKFNITAIEAGRPTRSLRWKWRTLRNGCAISRR
jgi:ERF superfamily